MSAGTTVGPGGGVIGGGVVGGGVVGGGVVGGGVVGGGGIVVGGAVISAVHPTAKRQDSAIGRHDVDGALTGHKRSDPPSPKRPTLIKENATERTPDSGCLSAEVRSEPHVTHQIV